MKGGCEREIDSNHVNDRVLRFPLCPGPSLCCWLMSLLFLGCNSDWILDPLTNHQRAFATLSSSFTPCQGHGDSFFLRGCPPVGSSLLLLGPPAALENSYFQTEPIRPTGTTMGLPKFGGAGGDSATVWFEERIQCEQQT